MADLRAQQAGRLPEGPTMNVTSSTDGPNTGSSSAGAPWHGDAVSLVDAFRAAERSPVEELEATLAAMSASPLNAICHRDDDAALAAAETADVSLPFGGVPIGVKELDAHTGWPATNASTPFAGETAQFTDTQLERLAAAGVVLAGQTTASEFGGTNQTSTKLHGTTLNPWDHSRTPGGSSGGSAAAVAGGLCTIATGSDGGGSIRVPAGFCGLFGLKATYGRIPRGPRSGPRNLTTVKGALTRSVRDAARWFDVTNGFHPTDPQSLPRVEGWESGLGIHRDNLAGMRAIVLPDLAGSAVVSPEIAEMVDQAAGRLIDLAGLRRVDAEVRIPRPGFAWGVTGAVFLRQTLGARWPECAPEMTDMMRGWMEFADESYGIDIAVAAETARIELNTAMADLFATTDFVFAATSPDVAFSADGPFPTVFGGLEADVLNHGALTMPANIYGNPAASIPIGQNADGLPVGLQVLAVHHREPLLLDLSLLAELDRPWPLIAPNGEDR